MRHITNDINKRETGKYINAMAELTHGKKLSYRLFIFFFVFDALKISSNRLLMPIYCMCVVWCRCCCVHTHINIKRLAGSNRAGGGRRKF
jgi:hypothetical protein